MGHVLNNTIQDILARKARMDGKEVLWLPGTDHAGIATQVQVEKALEEGGEQTPNTTSAARNSSKRVWEWKEKHGGIIIKQLKKLGCSCDWTRERFTMDPEYSRCVQKVFVELYKKGPDLSRQTHGELVPGLADRAVRRGSGNEAAERFPVSLQSAGRREV